MNDKYEKRWFWDRTERYDAVSKQNVSGAAAVEIPRSKIEYVSTRLGWWRAVKQLSLHFYIDGVEAEIGGWLSVPWLFQISITLKCDWGWFKSRYPELQRNDVSKSWGFVTTPEYFSFKWGYVDDDETPKGIYILKDWSDLIRGKSIVVQSKPAKCVYETRIPVDTFYPSPASQSSPVSVWTRFTVYAIEYTVTYTRWFSRRYTRYEVAHDQTFIVPGKGENSWDCDDENWTSVWDTAQQSAEFSMSGVSKPHEAVDAYLILLHRCQLC